jgi:multiple sugar transport system permease protein
MTIVEERPAPAAGPPPTPPAGKVDVRARAERRLAFWLCLPAVVVMLAVAAYPIIYAIYLSLKRYDLRFPQQSKFIGLSNYGTVLSSRLWWDAVFNTLFITVISVAIELVLGMAIALVMHRAIFARGPVRTAVLIPYGIITVVAAISWEYAWTPHLGWINWLIIGNSSAPLTHRWSSLFIIILSEVWKTTPFMALLLLAGLVLVPEDLLEAAKVDGATAWQRFTRVMLPIMKPAILVAVLFRTLDAVRIFDNVFILTNGSNNTASVSVLGYKQLFIGVNLGIGSAVSVLIFLMVVLIALIFVKGFGTAAPGSAGSR